MKLRHRVATVLSGFVVTAMLSVLASTCGLHGVWHLFIGVFTIIPFALVAFWSE